MSTTPRARTITRPLTSLAGMGLFGIDLYPTLVSNYGMPAPTGAPVVNGHHTLVPKAPQLAAWGANPSYTGTLDGFSYRESSPKGNASHRYSVDRKTMKLSVSNSVTWSNNRAPASWSETCTGSERR